MIPLPISNGKAYVWDVDAVSLLRSQHRICGLLTGTLPHMGSQNVFLGLPLVLMSEEVVLLVKEHIAYLVNDPLAHSRPTDQQLLNWKDRHSDNIANQLSQDSSSSSRAMVDDHAANEKRLARQAKKKQKQQRITEEVAGAVEDDDEEKDQQQPSASSETVDQSSSRENRNQIYSLTIPGASSFEWYNPQHLTIDTIERAQELKLWRYPSTPFEQARCAVFADLWKKGYTMGGGIKFGAEYLVYPGDPLRYHSHYAASVLPSTTQSFPLMDIVAHGRLGTATKKVHLLCGLDEGKQDDGKVTYFSIEWAGFG